MSKEQIFKEALEFHKKGKPGKVALELTKPLNNQKDLSLAYSPGVAAPCLEIEKDPDTIYDYTAKGNTVAVISNGTAILGLGDLGAAASKPVMEGKAVLLKKFGKVDSIDIEVDTKDPKEIINCVKLIAETWGGINLEDIKAPECFEVENELKKILNIPVFHDDQHGTAIVSAAGLVNALEIVGKDLKDIKLVINGAGAAAMACSNLLEKMGVENIIMCDSKGVIYEGRKEGMNKWKKQKAIKTKNRTLKDAMKNADVFLGVSVAGALTKDMVKLMADKPIIFAMANPTPEILPEEAKSVRDDLIMATGRSDYPNQVNNVMGFPYIFRGALDVRASEINEEMKIAAVYALADLAKSEVPEYVKKAYNNYDLQFGREYILPKPFDKRLFVEVSAAVAEAACETEVARKPMFNFDLYKKELESRI